MIENTKYIIFRKSKYNSFPIMYEVYTYYCTINVKSNDVEKCNISWDFPNEYQHIKDSCKIIGKNVSMDIDHHKLTHGDLLKFLETKNIKLSCWDNFILQSNLYLHNDKKNSVNFKDFHIKDNVIIL